MNDLRDVYRDGLLNDTLAFWFPRCLDHEHGGYLHCLDRDGCVLDTDKSVWAQARMTWMLLTLYNTIEQRPEWLEWARGGIELLDRYCFDTDGRMFFHVTCDGRQRRDVSLIRLGCEMLDYMWERGWDPEYDGIYYFRDLYGKPVQEYWHDMKFWWPHDEAIIATLLAWRLTVEEKYATWHRLVHDWAHTRFADPEHGEWYGYLHRDQRVSVTLKGNLWKSFFHHPRMQWKCGQILSQGGKV